MTGTPYSPAGPAAATVSAFFARHASETGHALSHELVPDERTVTALVDAAFWASLRREEGRTPQISLAFVPRERTGQPLVFAERLTLAPDAIARLAPAVERPGIHLGVWHEGGSLHVWGATRSLPERCFVIEVVEPGLLVLKYRRGSTPGKYGNIAIMRGDGVRVIDECQTQRTGYPPLFSALFASLLELDVPDDVSDRGATMIQLAISMRDHRRGGTLLVVPSTDEWRASIVRPVSYAISPPFTRLSELLALPPGDRGRAGGRDGVPKLIATVAGLTAVDGAAIITDRYEVVAFGAKIGRRDGYGAVEQVRVLEPVEGDPTSLVAPVQLGGTRHLSAAQFVHDQRDAIALVASQDGLFTVFVWSAVEHMVHAHRIEAVLF